MNNYTPVPEPQETRNESALKLEKEIQSSILLTDKDKKYWLALIPSMPKVLIDLVFKIISKKNNIVNRYIETAMADEPEKNFLIELRAEIDKINKQAFQMDEKAEQGNAEDILKELSGL